MTPFSFVHTADLHLDSPFRGLEHLSDEQSLILNKLRDATFKAFENVVELCLEKKVDFLLLAGDVYDGADRSLSARLRFRDGLRRLSDAGIHAFVVHGNHDPLDGWATSIEMPDKVHVFSSDLDSVPFIKNEESVARIHGISYPTKKISKTFGTGFQREGDEPFQIGLFHCNAGANNKHEPYAPRSIEELSACKLDYWALGHVHETQVLSERHPFIGYPGNTQGRHINESGRRGCFLVHVSEDGNLESGPQFVETDSVRWLRSEVNISTLSLEEELLPRIEREMDTLLSQAGGRPVVARISVTGRGPHHHDLRRPSFRQELLQELHDLGASKDPFVWIEKLEFQTRPDIDLDARRNSQDFLGELLRLIEGLRNASNPMEEIQNCLKELFEHKRAGRYLEDLRPETISRLLDEAESRCVDLLAVEDE